MNNDRYKCRGKVINDCKKYKGQWAIGWFVRQPNFDKKNCGYLILDIEKNEALPVIPETVGQCTGSEDENKDPSFEGDIITFISKERTGEERRRRSRNSRQTDCFAIYSSVKLITTIIWDESKLQWGLKQVKYGEYNTGFWRGCGMTKSEIKKNEYVKMDAIFRRSLSEIKEFKIIGNIHDK